MAHIEMFCNEEGIFRKSGSHSRIEQMITDLGSLPFESVASNPSYSLPDFSSVLKHYFKELPEPLLLRKHLEAYRQASDMDDEKRMLCLQLLMLLLPPTHHIVLTHLLHLLSIVSHSETSLMTPHNLAVVFGPTLFLHKTLDDVMGEVLPKVTSLLEYMIMHNVEIFEIPVEVRLVAEKYMKRREISEDTSAIPVDIYSSACKKTCSTSEFHEQGRDNAVAELASLYEYVKKMPDGPQKQMFLKKFETGSKMAGTPPPYVKSKKTKENKATPKLPKAVGSHQINSTVTPMRPVFKKGFQLLVSNVLTSRV
ncbi:PREDICTED: rho GTPase-activating protein 19-like [Amphimedon queenslandica]|uniref:Rho-GAP domain-containing protein n=1 Tax=Amphimedon queenslandica TaxID=400682 RepID=A0A1X7ST36_AMPQE|nr:PREDICTED: rho GTPase-activating protein 19-like [Amphimedon queenslandica]|eukprot:XP_019862863.1 PREDICTED: rho GTPase-activating protein 19-like [Amphimedon queenslandica]